MADVFVSYSRKDRELVQSFIGALQARGWSVWWDVELRGGDRFDDVIEERIGQATVTIVVWTPRSITSDYVKDEAAAARQLGRLVPIAVDDTEPPLTFRRLHTHRFREWKGSALVAGFADLMADLQRRIDAAGGPQPGPVAAVPAAVPAAAMAPPPPAPPPEPPRTTAARRQRKVRPTDRSTDPPAVDPREWFKPLLALVGPLPAPDLQFTAPALFSWTAVDGATSYQVQRSHDMTFLVAEDVWEGTELSYVDPLALTFPKVSLSPLRRWSPMLFYRVRAKRFGPRPAVSEWSNTAIVVP